MGHRYAGEAEPHQVATGVFLVGLALLFITGLWWPGVLVLIGAVIIARNAADGRPWYAARGAVLLLALAVFFLFAPLWPLLLIGLGLWILFGRSGDWRREHWHAWKQQWHESGQGWWGACDGETGSGAEKAKRKHDDYDGGDGIYAL